MFNVIESGIPASHAGWRKLKFFVFRKLLVGGHMMSLYNFENDVILPFTRSLGDPRIHFALSWSNDRQGLVIGLHLYLLIILTLRALRALSADYRTLANSR